MNPTHPASQADNQRSPAVYTIGYGSRSLDDLVRVLRANEIGYVLDVRSAPYSRFKPEFSKDALEAGLRGHGIRYLYLGDQLGGRPADRDCYVDDKVVYDRVKEKAFYRAGLARVQAAFNRGLQVALLCSEGKPAECHRSKLIGASLTELDIPVLHIDEHDALRTQDEVLNDLTDGQLSLFGDYDFTSRKRYQAEKPAARQLAEDEDA